MKEETTESSSHGGLLSKIGDKIGDLAERAGEIKDKITDKIQDVKEMVIGSNEEKSKSSSNKKPSTSNSNASTEELFDWKALEHITGDTGRRNIPGKSKL